MWGENNSNLYNEDELRLCTWQYTTRHKSILNFQIGDIVFLKSNPEHPIKVVDVDVRCNKVICAWGNIYTQKSEFPPECILQYHFASLVEAKSNIIQLIQINLN